MGREEYHASAKVKKRLFQQSRKILSSYLIRQRVVDSDTARTTVEARDVELLRKTIEKAGSKTADSKTTRLQNSRIFCERERR